MWGQPPSAVRRAKLDRLLLPQEYVRTTGRVPHFSRPLREVGILAGTTQPFMMFVRAIDAEDAPLLRVLCERVGRDAACTILCAARLHGWARPALQPAQ